MNKDFKTQDGLTAEFVRNILDYDPETGIFTWKRKRSYNTDIGMEAGVCKIGSGYRVIKINGKQYVAHRLAWLYVYGKWPKGLHRVNGNPFDNRIANLSEDKVQKSSIIKKQYQYKENEVDKYKHYDNGNLKEYIVKGK